MKNINKIYPILSALIVSMYAQNANATFTADVGTGLVSDETVSAGQQDVYNTGETSGIKIETNGIQFVTDGGVANGTEIYNGGLQFVDTNTGAGIANDTKIYDGGVQEVYGTLGGETIIYSGGAQAIGTGFNFFAPDAKITIDGGIQQIGFESGNNAISITSDQAAQINMLFGRQNVLNGSSIDGMTLAAGNGKMSLQNVQNGGTATNTVINSNGAQLVSNGGNASNTVINANGIQQIDAGGIATDSVVNANGTQRVSDGGTASGTTVNANGQQDVFGKLDGITTINEGGIQVLVDNAFIEDGATVVVKKGGLQAIGDDTHVTHIDGTGKIFVESGTQRIQNGSVTGTTVSGTFTDKGEQIVLSGTTAIDTILNAYGIQNLQDGGTASGTTVNANGQQDVFGTLDGITTINEGGVQILGATALIKDGATVVVKKGAIQAIGDSTNTTHIDGTGKIFIESGTQLIQKGSVIGTTVSGTATDKGEQLVTNGTIATDTILNAYGIQTVRNGGIANNTTVNDNGQQFVQGVVNGATINIGGVQDVDTFGVSSIQGSTVYINRDAGIVNYVNIVGGTQNLAGNSYDLAGFPGATANDTTITSGGIQNVGRNAIANNTTITDGTQNVQGILDGVTTIAASGVQNILKNYKFRDTATITIDGGVQNIGDGIDSVTVGSSDGAKIFLNSGTQNVMSKASISRMNITSGSIQNVFGDSWFTEILGIQNVKSGGKTHADNIASGGIQNVEIGGTVSSSDILTGGIQNVFGTASGTNIQGGTQIVTGTLKGDTTLTNGVQNLLNGFVLGTAENDKITINGGVQNIGDGLGNNVTIANASQIIMNGGVQNLNLGSSVTGLTISGGTQNLFGTAENTIIGKNGIQNVKIGGIVSGTNNLIYGNQIIESGANVGDASNYATVKFGGVQTVDGTSGYTIVDGGTQNVNAGGNSFNATINAGTQNVFGTTTDTTVNVGANQIFKTGSILAGNNIVNGGSVWFEDAFSAQAGSALVMNGGGIGLIGSGNHMFTQDANMAISGNGIINVRLNSGNNGNDSDFFEFGDIAGNYKVNLLYGKADVDALNALTSPIDIIRNSSVDTSLASFSDLTNGVDIGLYRWNISVSDAASASDPVIVSAVRSAQASKFVDNSVNHAYTIKSFIEKLSNSMHKRVGELQWSEDRNFATSGPDTRNGVWARALFKVSKQSENDSAKINMYGGEFGYDFKLNKSQRNKIFIGVMGYAATGTAEYTTQTSAINDSSDVTSYGLGLYAIWLGQGGWFADLALRQHFVGQDITAYGMGSAQHITFDTSHSATSANLDFGKEMVFGDAKKLKNSGMVWFLTPHVQVNAFHVSQSDFTTSLGDDGKIGAENSIQFNFALMGGPRWKFSDGSKLQLYAKAGYLIDTNKDTHIEIGGFSRNRTFGGANYEVGAGLNFRGANQRTSLFLDTSFRQGANYSEFSGILGLRYGF